MKPRAVRSTDRGFFLEAEGMKTDEGVRVKCPICRWWLMRVISLEAQTEVACPNWNCKAWVVVRREGASVSVTVVSRPESKQA